MMGDAEIVQLAATSDLTYIGFVPVPPGCSCDRCDKPPPNGSLHRFEVAGHPHRRILEVGPTCLMEQPTTGNNWRAVLTTAWMQETEPGRKARLRANLDEMLRPRR